MSDKGSLVDERIRRLRRKTARPCTAFETGGFRPAGDDRENWIGRVSLCKPAEAEEPVTDNDGRPLYPPAQFYLPDLPYVPEQLRHIVRLTVFIKISLTVETPPFGAVEFGFVWEGRNPFQ